MAALVEIVAPQQMRTLLHRGVELDLEAEIRRPVQTVRELPRWFRGSLRQAFGMALRGREQKPEEA